MKTILFLLILMIPILGKTYQPNFILYTLSEVSSIQISQDKLYISMLNNTIQIYHLLTKKFIQTIHLPVYQDFFGNSYPPKIFNTTTNKNGELAIVASNNHGLGNLYIYKNHHLELLLQNISIVKAIWLNDTQIIIGLLSHEIILFDILNKKIIYQTQISQASFSDMFLDYNFLFTAGESGYVYVINPLNGKIISKFDTLNKDKIFQIFAKNKTLVTAGQDRKVGIYFFDTNAKLLKTSIIYSHFLIYTVGLNHDAKKLAYLKNEQGEVEILNLSNPKLRNTLTQIKGIPNTILFYKDSIIISCDNNRIYFFNKGI